jgi:CheY-like chemotaxis protein
MGGEISAESKEGEGTTVTFTASLKKQNIKNNTNDMPQYELKDKNILLVEPDNRNSTLISEWSTDEGISLTVESSPIKALEILVESGESDENNYDVLIVDIATIEENYYDFILKIKSNIKLKNLGILALTDREDPELSEELKKCGFEASLEKPIFKNRLLKVIEKIVKNVNTASIEEAEISENRVKQKILLAEDDQINRKLACKMLEKLGYTVKAVQNGNEVINELRKEEYNIVLMDLMMPELDGIETTQNIRKELKSNIPVIALTAAALGEDQKRAFEAGMDDFIAKPIKPEELKEKISRIILF